VKTFSIGHKNERLISVNCNLCHNNEKIFYMTGNGFRYVKCTKCDLVFQDPKPAFKDLRERYKKEYFHYELDNDENFFNLMLLGLKDIRFFKIPLNRFKNNNFLDIGCATGMLVKHMEERGWNAHGVEICAESAEYGIKQRGVSIFIGSLKEAKFPGNHFSVIHFSHLIEHVPDPFDFLLEVHRVLCHNGMAIITTPNIEGFQARLFGPAWRSAISDHLTLFSKKTLKRMVVKAGFKVEKIKTWGGLAKGTAPPFLKKIMDRLSKVFGFGDVMLFQVRKE
jgi:2-polyprenyl-3-methyl-5-hydroxy-6-metoxy-1,4-benzoquinol methylase